MTLGIQQLIAAIAGLTDAFHTAVHVDRDVDAALAVLSQDCTVVNTPVGTGAAGPEDLRRYLTEDVCAHLPGDLAFRRVSRTVDQHRLVDESVVAFIHDRELPWLLPGVAPTHRRVEVLAISVVGVAHRSRLGRTESRIRSYRTLWDHSGLLVDLGRAPDGLRDRHATPA